MEASSPVRIVFNSRTQVISVELVANRSVLAYCFIGDDVNCEAIADALSTKKLPDAAMEFRKLVDDQRKQIPLNKRRGVRLTGL